MLSICSAGEESPLNSKGINPINPKGNQPWTFIGQTDADAEAPVLWPPNAKSWLIGKDPNTGKDWRQRRRRPQRVRWLNSITESMHMNLRKLAEIVKDRGTWHAAVHGVAKSQTWLCDWTATKVFQMKFCFHCKKWSSTDDNTAHSNWDIIVLVITCKITCLALLYCSFFHNALLTLIWWVEIFHHTWNFSANCFR